MSAREGCFYTRLTPAFRDFIAQGPVILNYHKVGPRPPGTRFRSMYVSTWRFRSQVAELHHEGHKFTDLDMVLASPGPAGARQVVVTFDDGFDKTHRHALPVMEKLGIRSIHFLVADLLGRFNAWDIAKGDVRERLMDKSQVEEWIAAGHEIGAHTRTHPFLTRIPAKAAREEIAGGKKKLEDLFGRPVRHFCYPFGDWNEEIRGMVAEAGYASACTVEPGIVSAGADPFALSRFTARYPSLGLKRLIKRAIGRPV
jgi:peptidoglycan/xylan/chitin deacetylase (PgdA/CDA1 family)